MNMCMIMLERCMQEMSKGGMESEWNLSGLERIFARKQVQETEWNLSGLEWIFARKGVQETEWNLCGLEWIFACGTRRKCVSGKLHE